MHPNKGRDDLNRVGDDAVVDEAVVDELWEAAVEDNADRVVYDVVVDDVGEAVVATLTGTLRYQHVVRWLKISTRRL